MDEGVRSSQDPDLFFSHIRRTTESPALVKTSAIGTPARVTDVSFMFNHVESAFVFEQWTTTTQFGFSMIARKL